MNHTFIWRGLGNVISGAPDYLDTVSPGFYRVKFGVTVVKHSGGGYVDSFEQGLLKGNLALAAVAAIKWLDVQTPCEPGCRNSFVRKWDRQEDKITVLLEIDDGGGFFPAVIYPVGHVGNHTGKGDPPFKPETPGSRTIRFDFLPGEFDLLHPHAYKKPRFDGMVGVPFQGVPMRYDIDAVLSVPTEWAGMQTITIVLSNAETEPGVPLQDEIDTLRQEYADHWTRNIPLETPDRGVFVGKTTMNTAHFDWDGSDRDGFTETAYDYAIFRRMGVKAEEVRSGYNRFLSDDPSVTKSPGQEFGIRISSGYRNPERNEYFRGKKRSRHQCGRSLDLVPSVGADGTVGGLGLGQAFCTLLGAAAETGIFRELYAETASGDIVSCDQDRDAPVTHIHIGWDDPC